MKEQNFYIVKDLLDKGYWLYIKSNSVLCKPSNTFAEIYSYSGLSLDNGSIYNGTLNFDAYMLVSYLDAVLFKNLESFYLYKSGKLDPNQETVFDTNILRTNDIDDWSFISKSKDTVSLYSKVRNKTYLVLGLEYDTLVAQELSTECLANISGFSVESNLDGSKFDLDFLLGKYTLLK